ncbi:TetR/AcrR family transcriptional regulator [Microbispora corallina]|uniref:TetR family transcriptional regulator n=1 Tax=Microbispora corallina TaxID=83302 RepID=A0ABQ4FV21_9ACTN|nr:TetR/AcrR family transcriptional regulator [Microbispora corallina]GIH38655.1 TetR family transcriptional regulator [Microbispora corallina]
MSGGKGTSRERYRSRLRAEIKEAALEQVGAGGAAALSLNAVARRLGLTGPALYKYFRGRDDLLTELVMDAYDGAAAAMRAACAGTAGLSPRERLHALAGAYRRWAVGSPHLYRLLADAPSPAHRPPEETVTRARAVLGPFLGVLAHGRIWPAAEEMRAQIARWIERDAGVAGWVRAHAPDAADPAAALAGTVIAWSRLHGAVVLEVQGRFEGMGHDPATLLAVETESLADSMGLPA